MFSGGTPSVSHRLLPIEGLRAYLALWVLVSHVLWGASVHPKSPSSLPNLLGLGPYAVDLFVIISGFVIFLLLDKQRDTYKQFIVRRFFRLFPVFILLFTVAIPLSQLSLWNVTQSSLYVLPAELEYLTGKVGSWWQNIHWHIPLHLVMLHGVIPEVLLKDAPGAFLGPAWSVSLEWQFYLVAPLAYALAVSSRPFRRLGLCAVCLLLFLAARYVFPTVPYGAAFPFHVEFFFLGAASYFVYKQHAAQLLPDTSFPVACSIAVFLFALGGKLWPLIPVGLWIAFMGLILEHPSSFSSRLVSPLFTNAFIRYLGRISYSIYLSHLLVIIILQYALLTWAPSLSWMVHFGVLLACTTAVTISISSGLYHFAEVPGMNTGHSLALRLTKRQAVGTHVQRFFPPRTFDDNLVDVHKPRTDRFPIMQLIRYCRGAQGSSESAHDPIVQQEEVGLTVNVSSGGICMLVGLPPKNGVVMRLSVPTPLPGVKTPTLAEVRWSHPLPIGAGTTFAVGLKFCSDPVGKPSAVML